MDFDIVEFSFSMVFLGKSCVRAIGIFVTYVTSTY